MLTYTIAEYMLWRQGFYVFCEEPPPLPAWEPTPEVERIMRRMPERGGAMFNA